jgi:hypothetical protein
MATYPCLVCGIVVFAEPPGSYEIFPACDWEYDDVQLRSPGSAIGANALSLYDHQRQSALQRAPLRMDRWQQYPRTVGWRPLLAEEAADRPQQPRDGRSCFDALTDEAPRCYWESPRPGAV